MTDTKFKASEPSGSKEEDLFNILCISMVKPRTPWGGAILDPGPLSKQTLERTTSQSYVPNFEHLSLAVSEEILSIFHFQTRDPHRRDVLDHMVTN